MDETKLVVDSLNHYTTQSYLNLDINECADLPLNPCHLHADCLNVPGTYKCECRVGYTGNGLQCAGVYLC